MDYDQKKQSQFVPARIDAKSYMKGDYGDKTAIGAEKNKANLSLREHSQCTGLWMDIRIRMNEIGVSAAF